MKTIISILIFFCVIVGISNSQLKHELPKTFATIGFSKDVQFLTISASASKDAAGKIHVTITNLDPANGKQVTCDLRGTEKISFVRGQIVTGEKINSYNDFGKNEDVTLKDFSDVKMNGTIARVKIPAKSVVMIELQ